jgi:hypothetical protein
MTRFLLCVALLLIPSQAWAGFNLLVNGNFESTKDDFLGFTTDYTLTTAIGDQKSFGILKNPASAHPSGASYFDLSKGDGTGLMMAVNEATTAN